MLNIKVNKILFTYWVTNMAPLQQRVPFFTPIQWSLIILFPI